MFKNKKIYVAPMMQYTDKHDRFFLRLISKNVILFHFSGVFSSLFPRSK